MKKKRIALGLFVLAMLSVNIFLFLNSNATITGSAIGPLHRALQLDSTSPLHRASQAESNTGFYFIVLIGQIFLLAIIMAMENIERKEGTGEIKSLTDIDIFYIMLQKNKILKLNTVSKAFNIPKELALEWAKILEEHNMAKIRYHTFVDTEIASMDYEDFLKKQKELQKIKNTGKEIVKVSAPVTNAVAAQKTTQAAAHKEKNYKAIAAFLSLFLGFLGMERIYLGYVKTGILKLIVFCGVGVWIYFDWFYLGNTKLDIYKISAVSLLAIWFLVDFLFILTGVLKPKRMKDGKKQA